MNTSKWSILALTLLSLNLAACGNSSTSSPPGTLTIAAIVDQSGPLGSRGAQTVIGIEVAINEINKAGGIKVGGTSYKLRVLSLDTRGDANTAVADTLQAVSDQNVKFMFGGLGGELVPMAKASQNLGAIHFTQTTSAQGLFTADPQHNQGLYQTTLGSKLLYQGYAKMLQLIPGVKKVAFLISNIDVGKTFVNQVGANAQAAGLTVVASEYWNPGSTDFTAALTRIKATQPDIVFVGFDPSAGITQVRQAVELKVAGAVIGTPLPPSVALKDAVGGPLPIPMISAFPGRQVQYPVNSRVEKFAASYKALTGNDVATVGSSSDSTVYYDFVYMLAQAIEQAGSTTDLAAIERELNKISYAGVIGATIKFDSATHTPTYEMDACIVQTGKVSCQSVTP